MKIVSQRAMSPKTEAKEKTAFVPVRVAESIKARIVKAAEKDGLSVSEWWRQAALEKLRRDEK